MLDARSTAWLFLFSLFLQLTIIIDSSGNSSGQVLFITRARHNSIFSKINKTCGHQIWPLVLLQQRYIVPRFEFNFALLSCCTCQILFNSIWRQYVGMLVKLTARVPAWVSPILPSVVGLSRLSDHGRLSSIIHTFTQLLSWSALQTILLQLLYCKSPDRIAVSSVCYARHWLKGLHYCVVLFAMMSSDIKDPEEGSMLFHWNHCVDVVFLSSQTN